jgi:hypothetical protein
MSTPFTKSDRQFLKSVGILVESTLDETRLALATRIAKHASPLQVHVASDIAKLALIKLVLKQLLVAAEDHE